MNNDLRLCLTGCGLTAEPGDVYCPDCRDAADRAAEIDRMGGSGSLRT